jgi:hypothetical protein
MSMQERRSQALKDRQVQRLKARLFQIDSQRYLALLRLTGHFQSGKILTRMVAGAC